MKLQYETESIIQLVKKTLRPQTPLFKVTNKIITYKASTNKFSLPLNETLESIDASSLKYLKTIKYKMVRRQTASANKNMID